MTRISTREVISVHTDGWELPPPYVENSELQKMDHIQFLSTWTEIPINVEAISNQEETIRFKQLNYCAYYLSCIYQKAAQVGGLEEQYTEWLQRYYDLKQYLINLNVGLVYDMMNRSRFTLDHDDMSSDGFFALLRATDAFDPWRGFRFSTYACNSILKSFARLAHKQMKKTNIEPISFELILEKSDASEVNQNDQKSLFIETLTTLLEEGKVQLNNKETEIIMMRFFAKSKNTLDQVGKIVGLSKERVRQIQNNAISKIKSALLDDPILQ